MAATILQTDAPADNLDLLGSRIGTGEWSGNLSWEGGVAAAIADRTSCLNCQHIPTGT